MRNHCRDGPPSLCLAIVRENGTDVVLFDASGKPRTFRHHGSPTKLCFSTHGALGVDEMLTPCLDEDGMHGVPDESCFCGIETPHIHAHKHDSVKCQDDDDVVKCHSTKKQQADADVSYLASVTLLPGDNVDDMIHFDVSDSHPQECNSEMVSKHLNEQGFTRDKLGRRVTKIKHGDHVDHLVHNETTGNLHLEHDCNDCGAGDLHGKFDLMGKRKLQENIQLHFFRSSPQRFSIGDIFGLDTLSHIFDPESDRVNAIRPTFRRKQTCCLDPSCKANLVAKTGSDHEKACCESERHNNHSDHKHDHETKGRGGASGSTHDHGHLNHDHHHQEPVTNATVKKGYCSSGDHHIHERAKDEGPPVPAVTHHHDSTKKGSINKSGCCSSGSCSEAKTPHMSIQEAPTGKESRSVFHCTDICCASEIPLINTILEPRGGITNVKINVAAKHIVVDYDHSIISAEEINKLLDAGGFKSTEQRNKPVVTGNTGSSQFLVKRICCASEIPAIKKILEHKMGVAKIAVNVTAKMVYVDHDTSMVSAQELCDALNADGFDAFLLHDGAPSRTNAVGRSHFYVEKICCASEISVINAILEPIGGVNKVQINVTTKTVYVDHDTAVVTAQTLCDALNRDRFGAEVRHDAQEDMGAPLTSFVRSTFSFSGTNEPANEVIMAFMETYGPNQVESCVMDLPQHMIHVVHNPLVLPADELCDSINEHLSLKAVIQVDGAANTRWEFPKVVDDEVEVQGSANYPEPIVIISGILWIISMLSFVGGKWQYLKYVALLSVAFALPPIALKAYTTLKRCQCDMNVLMSGAIIGAVALQEFTEAGAVAFLFSLSGWLESRATARARTALSEIVNLRPDKANLIHPSTKEIVVVPAAVVPVGALVSVKAGDKIPCDGTVLSGRSMVDESSLTGESRPVRKCPKDSVSGGTINSGMVELMVRTTSTAENSSVSRLIRLVEEAQASRSETEKMVEEFARYYTPVVILAAICMCTIPWALGADIGRIWTNNGLVMLVVACPCALIISTPVTYVAGLAATSQKGVLVKGGAHLETLGMVKSICFDKTGTLSMGNFALLHLKDFAGRLSRPQVLEYLALIEERAHHPLAQAIVIGIKNEGVKVPKSKSVKNPTSLQGEGMTALVDGVAIHVGNARLFTRLCLYDELPSDVKDEVDRWASLGGTVGFMSIDGHGIVCAYCVADAVRPESQRVVEQLQKIGIRVTMFTGDSHDAALSIGKQVGLDETQIRSQLFPEDKLRLVQELKDEAIYSSGFGNSCRNRPRIMFCGDGVNDAPALATADVGVAMGAGAALAMETSDITLLDSNLEKLLYSLRMGKRVIQKIRENVLFSFVVKIIVVGFTFSGSVHLWAAIAADVGAMLVVTLNGMTLLPITKNTVDLEADQGNYKKGEVMQV